MDQLIQDRINNIQHLRIASGQLGCNFGIDFHLWVNTGIVHNEVVHTFSQENTDFE